MKTTPQERRVEKNAMQTRFGGDFWACYVIALKKNYNVSSFHSWLSRGSCLQPLILLSRWCCTTAATCFKSYWKSSSLWSVHLFVFLGWGRRGGLQPWWGRWRRRRGRGGRGRRDRRTRQERRKEKERRRRRWWWRRLTKTPIASVELPTPDWKCSFCIELSMVFKRSLLWAFTSALL